MWEELYVVGIVGSVSVGGWGLRGILTIGASIASFCVTVLAIFGG